MIGRIIDIIQNAGIGKGCLETLEMVFASVIAAYIIGLPIGILVVCTDTDGLFPNKVLNKILGGIINLGRTIPFIILLVALIPFTTFLVGTSIGVLGMIVPLTVGAIPFVARMAESTFKDIDNGVIDAAKCMGCSNFQIICKVYIVESIPSLIRGLSITLIMLVGYSAMSGAVGGGGLGYIAIRYGYNKFDSTTMIIVLIILVIIVEIIQLIFDLIAKKIDKRK